MNKKAQTEVMLLLCLIVLLAYFYYEAPIQNNNETPSNQLDTIKIANWNLQVFGDTKASNSELMNSYRNKILNYDIIFVQEIRDIDGSAFDKLCSLMTDYKCLISSRAGRTASKEQYGIIFKKDIKIQEFADYNPDYQDRWERPPVMIKVFNLTIYNIHIKPDDASNELYNLESFVIRQPNTIVLGDFNMDCDYYNVANNDFDTWTPVITDNMDTTIGSSDCAYDRIFYYQTNIIGSNIDRNITPEMSDHYIVSVEVKI